MKHLVQAALAVLLLLAAPLAAQAPAPEGRWALRADGRTLMILELAHRPGAAGGWAGRLIRPEHFRSAAPENSDVSVFSEISGPIIARAIRNATPTQSGLRLTIAGARAGDEDNVLFQANARGTGALSYIGIPAAPLQFVRARAGETVEAQWASGRSYLSDHEWPTNAEMTSIYDADQADRASGGAAINWSVVTPRDEARRARVLALLDAGALHSGDDFLHAAFVLQHGSAPDDYLLAHTLAIVAAARGRADATWIAAATLDRYLQNVGRKQVYGTQFSTRDLHTTQEPYDRALVSDALRRALGVPPQSEQERRRAEIEAEYRARQGSTPAPH